MVNTFKDGEMNAGDKDDYEEPIARKPIIPITKPDIINAEEEDEQGEDLQQTMEGALEDRFEAEDISEANMLDSFTKLVIGHLSSLSKPWDKFSSQERLIYSQNIIAQCSEIVDQAIEVIASGNMESITGILEQVLVKDDRYYLKMDMDQSAELDLSGKVGAIVRLVIVETDQPKQEWPESEESKIDA